MRGMSLWAALLAGASFVACDSTPMAPGGDAGPREDATGLVDSDGDTITDADEGRDRRVDTDGDGTQDYLDLDSDDDGIIDAVEAGDGLLSTRPIDSDTDGIADFQDPDSDDNGLPDAREGAGDNDGDGIPDYRDLDDDNDFARDRDEIGGVTDPLADTDGDGVPNFRDPDSDNDLIMDGDEIGPDTDRDGLLDWEDLDSDDDGIPDRDEAGDMDIRSPPVDTDGDRIPDFRDPDSDNDGLSDALELASGTSPVRGDTDGDGVSDLIEVAAGTDPIDATVSPRTRGDFVFVVPYMMEPMPPRDTLEFRTNIAFADIYFLFDISGSMSGEIMGLRSAVGSLMTDLTCTDSGRACARDSGCSAGEICSSFTGTCIEDPGTSACLLSPWSGAGIYEMELENLLSLQPDPAMTAAALSRSTFGGTERLNRAVWGVADPMGAPGTETNCAPDSPDRVGCPGYRRDAVKILIAFTDENSDGTETAMEAATALNAAGISFIGIWSGTPASAERGSLVDIANAARSFDRGGSPLVFDGMDAAVVPPVAAAINEIVEGIPIRVTIEALDEPGDAGDALQFIDRLEVNTSGGRCSAVGATEDTNGDGYPDAFPALLPGTPVCWDVVARRNDTVEPALEPLVFRARLTVRGDGSPLDSRLVYFLIPPRIEEPGGPD